MHILKQNLHSIIAICRVSWIQREDIICEHTIAIALELFFTHKSTLLRFNLCIIKCIAKCTLQWIVTNVCICVTVTQSKHRTFLSPKSIYRTFLSKRFSHALFQSLLLFSTHVWLKIRAIPHFKFLPTLSTNKHAVC